MSYKIFKSWMLICGFLLGNQVNAINDASISSSRPEDMLPKTLMDIVKKAQINAKIQEESSRIIVEQAEKRAERHQKGAQLHAKQVNDRLKNYQFKEFSQTSLADSKGVNTGYMLAKYHKQFQQSLEEHQKIPELMVFVSLSMPAKGLQELGEQAAKAGGVLVLRGMNENSLSATIKKVHELSGKGIPVIIHPKLFKQLQITTVPVITLLDGNKGYCLETGSKCSPIVDMVTGNISLYHALELFSKAGDYKEKAEEYLSKLRRKA